MDKKRPKDSLRRTLIAKNGKTPPLYRYGFPYTQQYALDYARRHHLKIKLVGDDIEAFGGREELDFADVDDSWLQERDSWVFVMAVSRSLMLQDLSRRCGFSLDAGRPFSLEWDGIISLWSNYTIEERWLACPGHEEVLRVLEEAMNEVEGHNSKVQWWFDWNNDIVCPFCFCHLAHLMTIYVGSHLIPVNPNDVGHPRIRGPEIVVAGIVFVSISL